MQVNPAAYERGCRLMLRSSLKRKVNVLVSTYNGGEYVSEQLNSLVNQDCSDFVVHVRDDGSHDKTPVIAGEFCGQRKGWDFRQGSHQGVFGSFMDLLRNADNTSAYFAFCDQDDIWLSDKLSRAVCCLEKVGLASVPTLYCARVNLVDSSLHSLGTTRSPGPICFNNAVVENVITGCTIVMNRSARNLLLQKIPTEPTFHDWWCYLVISAFGKVIYDSNPRVLHRRHSGNTSMDLALGIGGLIRRAQRTLNAVPGKGPLTTRLTAFYALWGKHLPETPRRELERFVQGPQKGILERLRLAFTHPYRRNLKRDQVFLTLAVLLGKY